MAVKMERLLSKAFHRGRYAQILVRLRDNVVVAINQEFTDVFGYAPEEIVERDIETLDFWISQDVRHRIIEDLRRCGRTPHRDHPFNTKQGVTRIVSYAMELIEDDGEQYICGTMQDATEHRLSARRLADSEQTLRVMIDANPEMTLLLSLQGIITAVNRRACEIFDLPLSKLLGARVESLLSMANGARLQEDMAAAVEQQPSLREMEINGHIVSAQTMAIFSDSQDLLRVVGMRFAPNVDEMEKWLSDAGVLDVHLETGRSEQKQMLGYVFCAVDVTEQRRLTREREQLICDLQRALSEVKTLRGLLPVCAHCKKIRNEEGEWEAMEIYVSHRSEASFSHGVCPDCKQRYYAADLAARRLRAAKDCDKL